MAYVELASVVIAAAAAWAAFRSARASESAAVEARKASQAEVVRRLLDDYSSASMLTAIAGVRRWGGGRIPIDSAVDRQRRLISHYFQKVTKLGRAGLLDEDLVRTVLSKEQASLFCRVVERMEAKVSPAYDRSPFDWLAGLYGGRDMLPHIPPRSNASLSSPDSNGG